MSWSNTDDTSTFTNKLDVDELNYDRVELTKTYVDLLLMLTNEQRVVYDKIMKWVLFVNGGLFFLYGYGGTGKTFIWKTLFMSVRSKG